MTTEIKEDELKSCSGVTGSSEKQSSGPLWFPERERLVLQAIKSRDTDCLRHISSLPGGFGSPALRRKAWRVLLNVDRFFEKGDKSPKGKPHEDERQVLLDIHRSFVTYPRDVSKEDKLQLQEDLRKVITSILRRHPRLSYFQGYHDIVSVFYLSMLDSIPRSQKLTTETSTNERENVKVETEGADGEGAKGDEEQEDDLQEDNDEEWIEMRRCAEVVSLCRVRDAMGKGLEPMMGYLKLLRRILRLADPHLYRLSAAISPVPTLPFFALSWILTLFSHDIDTLEPIQRIFDYLIARNPISAIYLAVAIICAKKPQMIKLAKKLGPEVKVDPSLIHPLFARLPPLYPDSPDHPDPPPAYVPEVAHQYGNDSYDEPNPYSPLPLSKIFSLADKLMVKYPWDGPRVRGREILGPGSVVSTYSFESQQTLSSAESFIDNDVILPGGDRLDDEPEDISMSTWDLFTRLSGLTLISRSLPLRMSIRLPPNKMGTMLAVGVLALGIGLAYYGRRYAGGWSGQVRAWAGRRNLGDALGEWVQLIKYVGRSLREVTG